MTTQLNSGGVALIRETAKALARQVPAIDALIRQRDDLLRERQHQRALYLDLLVKTLTNVIYGDPSIFPGQTGFDPKQRDVGGDWPSVGHTMVGVARMRQLAEEVATARIWHLGGDGVYDLQLGVAEMDHRGISGRNASPR
jgi:hypothetical protein